MIFKWFSCNFIKNVKTLSDLSRNRRLKFGKMGFLDKNDILTSSWLRLTHLIWQEECWFGDRSMIDELQSLLRKSILLFQSFQDSIIQTQIQRSGWSRNVKIYALIPRYRGCQVTLHHRFHLLCAVLTVTHNSFNAIIPEKAVRILLLHSFLFSFKSLENRESHKSRNWGESRTILIFRLLGF